MLLVKKLMYKVCNYLNNIIVVESMTLSDSLVVGANNAASASTSVAKSGYTPIGIIGTSRRGGGSGLLADAGGYVDLTTGIATVQLYNPTSTQRTVAVTANILYLKKVGGVLRNLSIFKAFSDCKPSERMVASC